jgi:hypothetical protein
MEVAKPYEPTACEAQALASYESRQTKKKPAPGLTITTTEEVERSVVDIKIDHPDVEVGYRLVAESLGTGDRDFVVGTLDSLALVARTGKNVDQRNTNYALSMVRGIQPKDSVEVTLAVQMAAIHIATMRTSTLLGASTKRENIEAYEKSLNRLARTYVAQVEGLKRYRSKGEQRVYVERVTVNEGGQAIVGPVSHRGRDGEGEKNGE